MNSRQLFQQYLAQSSDTPIGLHIQSAQGNYLYDIDNKRYIDLIGGISVCNVGHCHQKVVNAIQEQAAKYLHVMVYGELIQTPQLEYAQKLIGLLPSHLNSVFFTNSGAEATEAAIKLCRRVNQRPHIIAANNSYHGHTTGALSVMGSEYWRNAFRPLLPGVFHFDYNSEAFINHINKDTSCVIIETVQSEAGVIVPNKQWLKELKDKCSLTNTILIFDEIQTGFGRSGKLWGFEWYDIMPDMILLGKALGGGLPMGALIAPKSNMDLFMNNPVLGHMTTFGGHPLCATAGLAALKVLEDENLIVQVTQKEQCFLSNLKHPKIIAVRSFGLLIALELDSKESTLTCLKKCLVKGIFSDWFLFADNCIRIAPPLTITLDEIEKVCIEIVEILNEL